MERIFQSMANHCTAYGSKNKIASSFILCQKTTSIAITAGAQSSSSSNSFSFCLRFLCGSLGGGSTPINHRTTIHGNTWKDKLLLDAAMRLHPVENITAFNFCLYNLSTSWSNMPSAPACAHSPPPPPSVVVHCSIQRARSRLKHAELVPTTAPPHARVSLRSTHTRSDPSSLLILQDFL
jgi:hypothetical protein